MFPKKQLDIMLRLTNRELISSQKKAMTTGELLKFFGVMILSTKFEFTSRASLWSNISPSKYVPAPAFGKTGMPRMRFDDIFRHIVWSEQPKVRPVHMSHEKYRWLLVDGFIKLINDYRAESFEPSDIICVDESISRWYGQGGHWINYGLPMYVAIDRKPDNGCEIQNACCGRSTIMMRLKLVKTAEEELTHTVPDAETGLLHGTRILLFLVGPWIYSSRTVVGDSYFASVGAGEQLQMVGLGFIGVVKTATKRFPMQYLSRLEMQNRGERKGLVTKNANGDPAMIAFVWMDRDRRYFIATSSSLEEGIPYVRDRWRQVDRALNADAERIELTVPQPKAAEIYYGSCGKIDQHNRHRQDTLNLESKLRVHDWSKRVNMTLFGMMVVDAWLAFSGCTNTTTTQKDFYMHLAEEVIDNEYDNRNEAGRTGRVRRRTTRDPSVFYSPTIAARTGLPRSGEGAHITPTKRMRKKRDGTPTRHLFQGRCMVCDKKCTSLCSQCVDEGADPNLNCAYICTTKGSNLCFATHMTQKHLS
jgi:hypothetical protein